MKLPNKVIRYNGSVLSKFPLVLRLLEESDRTPADLFDALKQHMDDVSDFVDILDCLFALGKITFTDNGRLRYAV